MNRSRIKSSLLALCLVAVSATCAWGQHGGGGGRGPGGGGGMGDRGGFPGGSRMPDRGGIGPMSLPSPRANDGDGGTSSTRAGLQLGPVGRWWDDRQVVEAIGLRKDQQKRMDSIFKANKQALVESYKALQREQNKLSGLTQGQQLDKTRMFASIDAVSQARAALEKANTQMILQLREELDAEQIQKLERLR